MKRLAFLSLLALGACDSDFVDPAYRSGGAGDHRSAFEVMLPMAETGSAGAQFVVASMYELGKGTEQSESEAARWFLAAAMAGDPDAQLNIGLMYRDGRGVPKDAAEAERWLDRAARFGLVGASRALDRLRADRTRLALGPA